MLECASCKHVTERQKDFPEETWSYMLKRGAKLMEEHGRMMHQWETGRMSQARLIEFSLRLSRTDALVAQGLASHGRPRQFFGEEVPSSKSESTHAEGARAYTKRAIAVVSAGISSGHPCRASGRR